MMELQAIKDRPLKEYMLSDEVEFCTNDLFEKYGFADGDLISDLYYEYMIKVKGVKDSPFDPRLRPSLQEIPPLYRVIKDLVLPHITPKIKLTHYVTCHNGVRCDEILDIKPEYVYVPVKDVLLIFDDIYNEYI